MRGGVVHGGRMDGVMGLLVVVVGVWEKQQRNSRRAAKKQQYTHPLRFTSSRPSGRMERRDYWCHTNLWATASATTFSSWAVRLCRRPQLVGRNSCATAFAADPHSWATVSAADPNSWATTSADGPNSWATAFAAGPPLVGYRLCHRPNSWATASAADPQIMGYHLCRPPSPTHGLPPLLQPAHCVYACACAHACDCACACLPV